MKCVTSLWLLLTAAAVACAIRVPVSWEEELDYDTYKTKLRKTRQKPSQRPVVERRVGGFAQANFKTKKPHRSKEPLNSEKVPVIQSRMGVEETPVFVPLDGVVNNLPSYKIGYQTLSNPNEENDWMPISNTNKYSVPAQNDKPNFKYNGIVRNSVINEENPMYQRWQETKGLSNIKPKRDRHKTLNILAEDDLIRQLEKHKILQQRLAQLDKSPGKLRKIYLDDQLNRKALNYIQQPSKNTQIDASEITFTTIEPEVSGDISHRKIVSHKQRRPKNISNNSHENPNFIRKKQKIIAENHRDDELHEPHKDTSERDDTLHEPENGSDDKIIDNETEEDTEEDVENENPDINKEEIDDEKSEEEDTISDEEIEKSSEETVESEHADPKNVSTKPIYPGEGQWAIPGKKHQPHISPYRYNLPETVEEKKPDGYDVFEDLSRYFDSQRSAFERRGQFTKDDTVQLTHVPVNDKELQSELPTPPPNTWRPNPPVEVNPVNPIIVYDPFNEPLETRTTSTSPFAEQTIVQDARREVVNEDKPSIYFRQDNVEAQGLKGNQETHNRYKKDNDEIEEEEDDEELTDNREEESEEDENLEIDPESISEEVEGDDEDEFVPMQLYTQVRHSADIKHVPHDPEESGRLKEVIRDSKVQTVYTEEGYEDLAYDHAGHEKKAESDERFAEFEKDKEEKGNLEKNKIMKKFKKKQTSDSLPLNTDFEKSKIYSSEDQSNIPISQKTNSNNLVSTMQIKTTELKDKGNGKLQMETQSKTKTMMQPNSSDTVQSSLTIFPKVYQDVNLLETVTDDSEVETTTGNDFPLPEINDNTDSANQINTEVPTELETIHFTTTASVNKTEEYANNKDKSPNVKGLHNKEITTEASVNYEKYITSEVTANHEFLDLKTNHFDVDNISVKSFAEIFPSSERSSDSDTMEFSNELKKEMSPLDKIDDLFEESLTKLSRQKRGSGFLNVNVDTEFIDNIKHTLPKPPSYDLEKYPYYKDKFIPENSPLKYAETLKNIPKKVKGELSFYEKAEEMECPELDEPNPIPEHVKNKANGEYVDYDDDDEGNKNGDEPGKPRIELGNKIKCYKKRYFGDNPLDSPFFQEEFVGPVKPIFKELAQKTDSLSRDSVVRASSVINTVEKANDIFNALDKDIKNKYSTDLKNKEFAELAKQTNQAYTTASNATHNQLDATVESVQQKTVLRPPGNEPKYFEKSIIAKLKPSLTSTTKESTTTTSAATSTNKPALLVARESTPLPLPILLTTPKYTLKLTPKSIYDQITLLDHLYTSGTEYLPPMNLSETEFYKANRRESKSFEDDIDEESSTVQPQQLRRRLRPHTRPNFHILPKRRGSTTTPFPIIDPKPTTVLPKYKVLSEVFYKDEIQPNEQLAVFSDILNNIRNSSKFDDQVQIQSISNFAEPSAITVNSVEKTIIQQKKIPTKIRKDQNLHSSTRITEPLKHTSVTSRPLKNTVKIPENKKQKQTHRIRQTMINQQSRKRKKPSTTTKRPSEIQDVSSRKEFQTFDFIIDKETILGLVPPDEKNYQTIIFDDNIDKNDIESSSSSHLPPEHLFEYKTIIIPTTTEQMPAPVSENLQEPIVIQLNKYLFLGLKPPKPQKLRPYTEFILNNNALRKQDLVQNRRYKREAQRPAYSELSRNRGRQEEILEKPDVSEDDVDDYVPHRPRNYYYDEKTGKIVYLNKPKQQSSKENEEEEEEIIEYEEITEPRPIPELTTPKTETKLLLATAKPPPDGESFIDYLNKVRNNPSYKLIPDPTTTEKGSVPQTTETIVPKITASTNPPEFLNILAKIKSDSSYKHIDDPKDKKKTTTTTEAAIDEVEEEVEESEEVEDPAQKVRDKSGVFDISEYLPEIREYTPRHKIDYSRYKTISRGASRQRPSLSNQEEKIDYTAIVRARKPVYDDEETTTLTTETQQENRINRYSQVGSESRLDDLSTLSESTSLRPSNLRRRPSKNTTKAPITTEKLEKNLEILAPPIQSRRGTRPTTTTSSTTSSTTPTLEIQEPSTRLPAKKRRTTTPRGYEPSLELVRTTEAVMRVYPENHRAKRVYRRQPVHIASKVRSQIPEEVLVEIENSTKIVRRRSERLSDAGQATLLDPIYVEDGTEELIDREDRSIAQTGNAHNHQDVEVFKKYNKHKKHGGNYQSEGDKRTNNKENDNDEGEMNINSNDSTEETQASTKDTLSTQKDSDKIFISTDSDIELKESTTSVLPKSKRRIASSKNIAQNPPNNRIPDRLSDVVPKPDHFYTDPSLPKQVNQLGEHKDHLVVNSEELEEIVTEGDQIYSSQETTQSSVDENDHISDRMDVDEVEFYDKKHSPSVYVEDKTVPNKKPLFIKDPDKRLYFYAPI